MTELRFVCRFQCDGAEHTFVLPRQSPLGTYVGEQYQPTGIWPIEFLCLQHGHVCRVTLGTIRLESVETRGQDQYEALLWKIEYECARQNCGQRQTIYTRYSAVGAKSDVLRVVSETGTRVLCSEGHEAKFGAAQMELTLLGS